MRVKMLESKKIEVSQGSFVHYQAGELYLLPEEVADQWIGEGTAVEPEAEEGDK